MLRARARMKKEEDKVSRPASFLISWVFAIKPVHEENYVFGVSNQFLYLHRWHFPGKNRNSSFSCTSSNFIRYFLLLIKVRKSCLQIRSILRRLQTMLGGRLVNFANEIFLVFYKSQYVIYVPKTVWYNKSPTFHFGWKTIISYLSSWQTQKYVNYCNTSSVRKSMSHIGEDSIKSAIFVCIQKLTLYNCAPRVF